MSDAERCPKPKYLIGYVENQLTQEKMQKVGQHLMACPNCLRVTEGIRFSKTAPAAESQHSTPTASLPNRTTIIAGGLAAVGWISAFVMTAILAAGAFNSPKLANNKSSSTEGRGANDSEGVNAPPKSTPNEPVSMLPQGPLVGPKLPESTPKRVGFQMGNLASETSIETIKVTLEVGEDLAIDEVVDLHLGFGFPLRLAPLNGPADGPVFAAFPTSLSQPVDSLSLPAGEKGWYLFDRNVDESPTDSLRTSAILLDGLSVGDIDQIGFAAQGQSDWELVGYRIEINGELYASNDQFNQMPVTVNSEAEQALAEMLPMHDALVEEINNLEAVIQTGLATDEDYQLLKERQEKLESIATPIRRMGGQLLGLTPSLFEFSAQFEPLMKDRGAGQVKVQLLPGNQEMPGTSNPLFLNAGGKKFLLASEQSPLRDENELQSFLISESDLLYNRVTREDFEDFSIGMLGSNEPFAEIPDRTSLQRVLVELDGDATYDSESQLSDRQSLERVVLIPPIHRGQTGELIRNQASEVELYAWRPGIEFVRSGFVPDPMPRSPEKPRNTFPGGGFGPDVGGTQSDPNGTGSTPFSNTPGGGFPSGNGPGGRRPFSRQGNNGPRGSLSPQDLAKIVEELLKRLLPNSQSLPVATNTNPGGTNPTNNPSQPGTGNTATPNPGANSPTNPKQNPNPKPVAAPKKLQIKNVRLATTQRMLLRDRMRPVVEWDVENGDEVASYQARVYAVLPHRDQPRVMLSQSPLTPATVVSKSLLLPPVNASGAGIPVADLTRLFVEPEIVAFDAKGEVIQTGYHGTGPLVPLYPRGVGRLAALPLGPHASFVDTVDVWHGYQVNGDGYGPPATKSQWHSVEAKPQDNKPSVWFLNEPTNAHTAKTFDPLSMPIGIDSAYDSVQEIVLRFEDRRTLNSNMRLIGHLGMINGPVDQANEATIETRVIVQRLRSGGAPTPLAELSSTSHPQKQEVLRITTAPITYKKIDQSTPLMLIDIPIALEKVFADYNETFASSSDSPVAQACRVDSIYEKSLPVGKVADGLISLTLKIKLKSRKGKESLGLFGMRLVEDVQQPLGGIPDSPATKSNSTKPAPPNKPTTSKPDPTKPKQAPLDVLKNFRIATYNTYLFQWAGAPNRLARAKEIASADFVEGLDVLILNELFDPQASPLLLKGLSAEYPYQTPIVGLSENDPWDQTRGNFSNSPFVIRGGVAVVSKWPIEEQVQHIFAEGSGWDNQANKGFAYVRIRYEQMPIHIIATHTQAADGGSDPKPGYAQAWAERGQQFDEIRTFIDSKNIPADELVLIGGDLNVIGGSSEYQDMLRRLGVKEPTGYQGEPFTYDPPWNGLIGDSSLPGERLDYIFVSESHLDPKTWFNDVKRESLSDHYPVFAGMTTELPAAPTERQYELLFRTGSKYDSTVGWFQEAGTDSNISIRLVDAKGESSTWYKLPSVDGDFDANVTKSFTYMCELEDIQGIEIMKDNFGAGPDWFLDQVTIRLPDGKTKTAQVNEFLDYRRTFRYSFR